MCLSRPLNSQDQACSLPLHKGTTLASWRDGDSPFRGPFLPVLILATPPCPPVAYDDEVESNSFRGWELSICATSLQHKNGVKIFNCAFTGRESLVIPLTGVKGKGQGG